MSNIFEIATKFSDFTNKKKLKKEGRVVDFKYEIL